MLQKRNTDGTFRNHLQLKAVDEFPYLCFFQCFQLKRSSFWWSKDIWETKFNWKSDDMNFGILLQIEYKEIIIMLQILTLFV